MATLLQYRSGQVVPVKVDGNALKEHYGNSRKDICGRPVYFEKRTLLKKKRMYISLMMAFVIFDATLLALVSKMLF